MHLRIFITAALALAAVQQQQLAGPCFTVHGRMRYSNGAPSVRIWTIGTNRILGVEEEETYNCCTLPKQLRDLLEAKNEIYADFKVCPLTKYERGVMQLVQVSSASHIVTKPVKAW